MSALQTKIPEQKENPQMKTIFFGEQKMSVIDGGMIDRYRMNPDLNEIEKRFGINGDFFRGWKKELIDYGPMKKSGMPIFYYDMSFFQAIFTADFEGLSRLLPDTMLRPLKIWPGRGMIGITAFEYRLTDVDPYNEVAISIVTEKPGTASFGPLTLTRNLWHRDNWTWIWQLPVTTEFCCIGGRLAYNLPKYVTRIDYETRDGWDHCTLYENGQKEIVMRGRHIKTKRQKTIVNHAICLINNAPHDAAVTVNPLGLGSSGNKNNFVMDLGQGEIARTLHSLKLGKMLRYDYGPRIQTVLPATRPLP